MFIFYMGPKTIRKLVFVHGKGGVGKTAISQSLALGLSQSGKKTLWSTFEDPFLPKGETLQISPKLWHLNCDATQSFEEYAHLKIAVPLVAKLFARNKLVQSLVRIVPGIHELVLIGKVWEQRNHYDHVVVDMPSSGYALTLFKCTENFSRLFQSGPLQKDALAMLQTFADPSVTDHWILALPEEMPLIEALEFRKHLKKLFPKVIPKYWVNRIFPSARSLPQSHRAALSWNRPQASSAWDYSVKRSELEAENLKLWSDDGVLFQKIPYFIATSEMLLQKLADYFEEQL